MVEKILNNTTSYGKIRASHEGSLHSSTLIEDILNSNEEQMIQEFALDGAVMQVGSEVTGNFVYKPMRRAVNFTSALVLTGRI